MDNSIVRPEPGQDLAPKEAKKFFEFFRPGTEREVIMLGDLVEQHVHYVRWKNHKVLCGARIGQCDLCARAGTSDDVSDRHVEYYAATVVKGPKEKRFLQRVSVFTAVAGEELLRIVTEGSLRGHRFTVKRISTQRAKITMLAGPPRGLSHVVPAEFDLLPFIRGRFGLPQDPTRPAVFLEPFECKDLVSGPAHRPRPLDVSADDVKPSAEILAKFHHYVEGIKAPAPAADDQVEAEAEQPTEKEVIKTAADPTAYGPRDRVEADMYQGARRKADNAIKTPGAELFGDVLSNLPNGHPVKRGRKGGA